MESKWYFFPGQNEQNTKISDRAHALHVTQKTWQGITRHLDRKKRIQEALDKEEAHKRALKEGSEAMTKQWKDSTENIRARKDEERRERFGQKKDDKFHLFYKMREEQEAVRKEYVEKMKKKTFISSGYPRELTSALILSETLYERDRQREFDEKLKLREREIEERHARAVFERDERERREDEEEKRKRLEDGKKVAEVLVEQIDERRASKSEAIRSHIERETRDRIRAAEEEELLKEYEKEEKMKLIRERRRERLADVEAERRMRQQLKKEEEEFEKAVEFYSSAKHRIECMKKQKEKEMREEAIAQHEILASKVAQEQEDKETAENERIAKAVAEREEAERAKHAAKLEIEAKAVKDRIEDRKQYLQRLEEQKRIENEIKRWEMLNRIKTAETVQEYNEQTRRDKWAKILEYRKELLEQMAEEREIQKQEKEIEKMLSRISFEENDRMFFNYAQEVLDYAKNKNRSTYPIEKVIMAYKTANRLEDKGSKRKLCTRHCCNNGHPA